MTAAPRRYRRVVMLCALTTLAIGCVKRPAPERPVPVVTPTPVVTTSELQSALRSIFYDTSEARHPSRKPRRHRSMLLRIMSVDAAVNVLMRDPRPEVHAWRQRAVVALAAASLDRYRAVLRQMRAPVDQLEMLVRATEAHRYDWVVFVLKQHIEIIYPSWIPFVGKLDPATITTTPTPSVTPTPTWTAPAPTWTPGAGVTPTSTITPSLMEAPAPCQATSPTVTTDLCTAKGVPSATCEPPKSGAKGTWIQVDITFSVNRLPSELNRILDPQNWDTCNPDLFTEAYVLPPPANNSEYPSVCAEVANPPSPGNGYPSGSKWKDVLYEHFDAAGAAAFKNRIAIDVTSADASTYAYEYWLDHAICSDIGLSVNKDGGLDVDDGLVEARSNGAGTTIHAVKKLSFTDRPDWFGYTGSEIDEEMYKAHILDGMGEALAKTVCKCNPK